MRFVKTMFLFLGLTVLGADDPFTGQWKLNLEKSKLQPPAPQSETVRINADTEHIRISVEGITAKGEPFKLVVNGGFDEVYYAVLDSPYLDTVWFHRPDSHTIYAKILKSGTEIENGTALVSKNGKILKINFSTNEANGKVVKAMAVLDRQ